jgi:hypothetical protein
VAKFIESDEHVTLSQQIEDNIAGPIILINRFSVNPQDAEQFINAWAADAAIYNYTRALLVAAYLLTMLSGSL